MPSQSDTPQTLNQHAIRRYAMQVLYQFDLRGDDDRDAVLEDIRLDAESDAIGDAAFELACNAWDAREACDTLTTELAPDWPTHRQPPLDRALLRLAYFDITSGRTHIKIAISEVVNLAKEFCAERSPAFINGVLDKMIKRVDLAETQAEQPTVPQSDKAWLDDAIKTDPIKSEPIKSDVTEDEAKP